MSPQKQTSLKPYKAYESKDGISASTAANRAIAPEDSLEIRQVKEPWLSPEWRYYMVPIYNGASPNKIGIIYSFLVVEIEGLHLQPLLVAIRKKTCIYIQDFHPQEHEPPEPNETIIHKIKVTFRREGEENKMIESMPKNVLGAVTSVPSKITAA